MSPSDFPQLRDASWLREQYVDRGRTQAQIAADVGCTRQSVSHAMRVAGVESRLVATGDGRSPRHQWVDVDGLWPRVEAAATRLGVTPAAVLRRALREWLDGEECEMSDDG